MNKKEILMQPNNIIKGEYICSPAENKLFYKILFNAQKHKGNESKYTTLLTKDDFKCVFKNNNELTEKNREMVLNSLKQTLLEFDYLDEDSKTVLRYSAGLIGESFYDYSKDTFLVTIHETLYNHITDFIKMQSLGNGYTALNLDLLFKFKGVYTQRLYTLFRLWSRKNETIERKYRVDDLRKYLRMDGDIYPEYKHFKHNVLKRGIKEINLKGNMNVEIIKETRKNRKVEEITFSITDMEPRRYFDKIGSHEDTNEKSIETDDEFKSIEGNISETKDFYIPNKKLFTVKTLENFTNDFKDYDFTDKKLKKLLQEAILVALEKDDEEKIKVKSYHYFKKTLINKINDSNNIDSNVTIPQVKTRFHNIAERFKNYEDDELVDMIKENYKDKRQREEFIRQEEEKKNQQDKLIRKFAMERIQNKTPLPVKDDKIWKDIIDEEVEKIKCELENGDLIIKDMNLEKDIHIS